MPKLNQKGVIHFLLPIILLIGLAAGVYLVTSGNPLKLFSKASNPAIVFKNTDGTALALNSSGIPQTTSPQIKIELTSTLGAPASGAVKGATLCDANQDGKEDDKDGALIQSCLNRNATGTCALVDTNRDRRINIFDRQQYSARCPKIFTVSSTAVPAVKPTSTPAPLPVVYTMSFKFAENPNDLGQAPYQPYTIEPTMVDYEFKDKSPGNKFIWVEFKDSNGKTDRRSAQIEIIARTDSASQGSQIPMMEIDSYTKEIYNLNIKPRVTDENTVLEVSGSLADSYKQLTGYIQRSQAPYGADTIEFTYQSTGYPRFTSKPIKLLNNNCFDLYVSPNKTPTAYLASFCYKVAYVQPNSTNNTIYNYSGHHSITVDYTGPRTTTVLFLTTAFNKNITTPMTRVSYLTFDQQSAKSISNFKNVVYNIQGTTPATNDRSWQEWCQIGGPASNPFPKKQIRFTGIAKPEGGSFYDVAGYGNGGCSFKYTSNYFQGEYISLYKEGWRVETTQVAAPQPPSTTPAPTPSPTPTPTPLPIPSMPPAQVDDIISSQIISLTPPSDSPTPYGSAQVRVDVLEVKEYLDNSWNVLSLRLSGILKSLKSNRTYQVWVCKGTDGNGIGCSSTSQPKIITDAAGNASFTDVKFGIFNKPSYVITYLKIVESPPPGPITPDQCYLTASPCLQSAYGPSILATPAQNTFSVNASCSTGHAWVDQAHIDVVINNDSSISGVTTFLEDITANQKYTLSYTSSGYKGLALHDIVRDSFAPDKWTRLKPNNDYKITLYSGDFRNSIPSGTAVKEQQFKIEKCP